MAQNALAEMEAEIRAGRGDMQMRMRQQFTTYLLSHNLAADIQHKAIVSGLDTTVMSGKGMFARSHLVTTRGTVKQNYVFWSAMLRWMAENA